MIKKMTIRFNLEDEQQRRAVEILALRNRNRYRSMADYIVPAVIEYADQNEQVRTRQLSGQDVKLMVREILLELEGRNDPPQEPGI